MARYEVKKKQIRTSTAEMATNVSLGAAKPSELGNERLRILRILRAKFGERTPCALYSVHCMIIVHTLYHIILGYITFFSLLILQFQDCLQ